MADLKITELTALTAPANADLFVIVDDVAGTATTKKITLTNALKGITITTSVGVQGAVATPGILLLSTAETTVVDGDKLGQINFSAPLEASGTDAILVSGSIWAEADDTFDATTNTTSLVLATGTTATAAEIVRINNTGMTLTAGLTTAGAILNLSTNETTVDDGDVLGRIDFQAPLEATGTDAILVSASVYAEADASFVADVNTTSIVFATGTTSTPIERVRIGNTVGITVAANTTGISLGNIPTGIYFSDVGATGEHMIDVVDAYLGAFIETGSYSSAADKGITLSDANTRPVAFLFDDSAAALTGNNRAVLSRVYLAESQGAGGTIVSIQGQLKIADDKDFSAGRFCAVDGYMEFGGTTSIATGTYVAAMNARVDVAASETVTVDSGGYLIGIHVHTTGTGTLTSTGSSYGIFINDQGTVDDWKVGVGIVNSTTGIDIGACTTGINFSGACTNAAIGMDSATFANGDHEIQMRNNVAGDKTIIASGAATSDGAIVTAVGADADIADGSLYMSCTDGAGVLFIKKNDVWTAITTA